MKPENYLKSTLSFQQNSDKLNAIIQKYIEDSFRVYNNKLKDKTWLKTRCVSPLIDLLSSSQSCTPNSFRILSLALHEISKRTNTLAASDVASQILSFLTSQQISKHIFTTDNSSSLREEAFYAIQACIEHLQTRIQATSFDKIIDICTHCIINTTTTQELSSPLAWKTLLLLCPSIHQAEHLQSTAVDFIPLLVALSQRHARYNSCEEIRILAQQLEDSLLFSQSTDVDYNNNNNPNSTVDNDDDDVPIPLVPQEPTNTVTMHTTNDDNDIQQSDTNSDLVRMASAGPLPLDYSVAQNSPVASIGESVTQSYTIENNNDGVLLSSLVSLKGGIDYDGSLVDENELLKYLRGSIKPHPFKDISNTAAATVVDTQEKKESTLLNEEYRMLLDDAIQSFYSELRDKNNGIMITSKKVSPEHIEGVLQRVLDMHAERLYEKHLKDAEIAMETCYTNGQKPDEMVPLLEAKVHLAVAQDQERFLAHVLPLMAETLML